MDMQFASERRTRRRATIVECQVVRERDFKLLGKVGIDLSTDGMLLLTDVPALTGEEVIVALRVPNTDAWIDTTATIARTVHGRRNGDPRRALGLEFDPLDGASSRLLRGALQRFPPTLPRRAPRIDYAATVSMIALG